MPRDVNGTYTLPGGNPVVTNTLISSVWGNTTLADVATALTNSLDRTGTASGMTGQFKAAAGTVGAPGVSWQLETSTGFYRVGAGDIAFSIAGVLLIDLQAAAITLWNSSVAGVATLTASNTSTTATQDLMLAMLSGSTQLRIYIANQNRATTVLTGGPATSQTAIYTTNANPIVFGTNSVARGTLDSVGTWNFTGPTGDIQTAVFTATAGQATTANVRLIGASGASQLEFRDSTNASSCHWRYGNVAVGNLSLYDSSPGSGTAFFNLIQGTRAIQFKGPVSGVLQDMTPDTGTFTITYTGMTAGVTGTARWVRIGNIVLLTLPVATGTSNSVNMSATGIPAAINPTRLQVVPYYATGAATNAGALTGIVFTININNTIDMGNNTQALGTWTNSGVKGISAVLTMVYVLN